MSCSFSLWLSHEWWQIRQILLLSIHSKSPGTGKNIRDQNRPGQNIPGQNVLGPNIPDKIYRTKYTEQNIPDKMCPGKTYQTIYTGQNIPDEIYLISCRPVSHLMLDVSVSVRIWLELGLGLGQNGQPKSRRYILLPLISGFVLN